MKQIKYILAIVTTALFSLISCNTLKQDRSEDYLDTAKLQQLIEQKSFIFDAQHVRPMQGPSRALTSNYTLRLSGDTIEAYLPYFGRAYSAPSNTQEGGIKFKSTDFDYKVDQRKNKSFDITIKPKVIGNRDLEGIILYLNIFEGGSTTLNINMTNRQPISFSGTISSDKKP